jgi:hypothetical protein
MPPAGHPLAYPAADLNNLSQPTLDDLDHNLN